MDGGKEILLQSAREAKAKDVTIEFIDKEFHHFNVLDSSGKMKHLGAVWEKEPHQKDFCTCESFFFSNSDEYKKAHPTAFQCKHLIKARELRYEGYPQ